MHGQSEGLRFNREAALSSIAETIRDGFYCADLFANEKIQPPIYHYIITLTGSTEVLDWGQGFSMDSVRTGAESYLSQIQRRMAS